MSKTQFLKICCPRCKYCQIVYGRSSLKIKCLSCNYLLLKTSGGKVKVRAKVREVLC